MRHASLATAWLTLQELADTLKSISNNVELITTQQGFLYLQVTGPGVKLSSEMHVLEVAPHEARIDAHPL